MLPLGIQVKGDELIEGTDERENPSEGQLANLRDEKILNFRQLPTSTQKFTSNWREEMPQKSK